MTKEMEKDDFKQPRLYRDWIIFSENWENLTWEKNMFFIK